MQAAKTPQVGKCDRIIVTAANGKVYDLGSPTAKIFKLRVLIYRIRRYFNG